MMLNRYAKAAGAALSLVCALQMSSMQVADATGTYYKAGTTRVRVAQKKNVLAATS